jgi:quercetin dioxygenase-like cupin family protein
MPKQIEVPGCTGTTVSELKRAHGLQFLEVNIAHGGEVPLHTHKCAATMIVTKGSARKLTATGAGYRVNPGDVIAKAPSEPHGFTDVGETGFQFISISDNEGIVGQDGNFDMTPA